MNGDNEGPQLGEGQREGEVGGEMMWMQKGGWGRQKEMQQNDYRRDEVEKCKN